jgi:hypothetical protein
VVRTYTDIKEMVLATTKIDRMLGDLGETPYDSFKEEKDEDATGESLSLLNETLIHFCKECGNRNGVNVSSSRNTSRC